jgi:hypothetical protein
MPLVERGWVFPLAVFGPTDDSEELIFKGGPDVLLYLVLEDCFRFSQRERSRLYQVVRGLC